MRWCCSRLPDQHTSKLSSRIRAQDNPFMTTGKTEQSEAVILHEKVFKGWDYLLFILLLSLSAAASLYFVRHWVSDGMRAAFPLFFFLTTLILTLKLIEHFARLLMLPLMRRPKPLAVCPGYKVAVVTTFVPGGEPVEMLERTLKALLALKYPHDTWVLDEGDDEGVRSLCVKLGAHHFSRKKISRYQADDGVFQRHSKHGNYNAWFYELGFDRYDIISGVDPDHIPQTDFLMKVLGYFADPEIGYVQAPAAYYNQQSSFIAGGAAEETYSYYSCTQMAANAFGSPFVTGCHNTHRVRALKEAGGFAPHDADDLLLTLVYRNRGWRGVYVPEILARGLAPVDWAGYLTQQLRWARSIIDVKLRLAPRLTKNISIRDRLITFLDVVVYLQSSISWLFCLALLSLMLATQVRPMALSSGTVYGFVGLCAILQLCVFYRQRFYLDPPREQGLYWKARILRYAKWPYTLVALIDVARGRRVPYTLTRKIKSEGRQFLLWPHALVALLISAAWVIGLFSGGTLHPLLHLSAAAIVIGSCALLLSEHMSFPDPYGKSPAFLIEEGAGSL
jgi:cellulose synthase (UDP-forming)